MAGDVKVAVVSGPISSSGTGTADFTKAGFGTPKACIVLLSFDAADDASVSPEGKASIGFSDFTNHRCITHQDEDGSAKVDSDARKSPTKAYVLLNVAGAVDIDGTVGAITDGVRLTNTTNASASAVFATVIMFGGADLQVSLDSVSLGSGVDLTTVVTTGIPQDLVFFIGTDIAAEDNSSTAINNSFGVADISNDQATIVNRCMGWTSDHNNNVGAPASIIRNDRCLKVLTEAAGDDWGIELTAATPTSYTVTTRDVTPGANMEVYALALNLDDRGSKVGSVDSPTSGATWTPAVALGFTPQYVGLGLTHAAVEGTIESDADAGGHGISSNTGPGEETFHGWYNEDASAAANTNNNFRSRAIDLRNDDVTVVVQDHSHSSFDSGGWTYTINAENETTAKKWFYWAIEEAAAPAVAVSARSPASSIGKARIEVLRSIGALGVAASIGLSSIGVLRPINAIGVASSVGTAQVLKKNAVLARGAGASTGHVNVSPKRPFAATGAASSTGHVQVDVRRGLLVRASGSATGAAAIDILRAIAARALASSTGKSTVSTAAGAVVTIAARAPGSSAGQAQLGVRRDVAVRASGSSVGKASCVIVRVAAATAAGGSVGKAQVEVRRELAAHGAGGSTGQAQLEIRRAITATGTASSTGHVKAVRIPGTLFDLMVWVGVRLTGATIDEVVRQAPTFTAVRLTGATFSDVQLEE